VTVHWYVVYVLDGLEAALKISNVSVAPSGSGQQMVGCPVCKGTSRVTCTACKGRGQARCPACGGKGVRTLFGAAGGRLGKSTGYGAAARTEQCINCRGTGFVGARCPVCSGSRLGPCSYCNGTGKVTKRKADTHVLFVRAFAIAIAALLLWLIIKGCTKNP
jgi:hypothetical protein